MSRIKTLIVAALLVAFPLVGCAAAAEKTATGVVVSVDSPTLGQVNGFTLRTASGETLVFSVGVVDQGAGAFPPQHLTEHQADGEPVTVTYTVKDGKNVATKLTDAAATPT
jgi:uncharacterized lipoprotein NlpE involved in copper resistance